MPKYVLLLLVSATILTAVRGQDAAPLTPHRVNGVDGKPWPIKISRRGLRPEIQTFDAPYVLTPGTPKPALWFLDGEQCSPLAYAPAGKRFGNFEVVHSGAEYFLTYTVDGVNEFWRLKGGKAVQVTLDGKPFSQPSRITIAGASPCLYHGDASGKTSLFEVKDGEAVPVELADVDLGTISYAWRVGGKLIAAFYRAGTYDFHVLYEGKWAPAWEHNGAEKFEQQVDSIKELWAGEKLFLSITRRDDSEGIWFFDGSKLDVVILRDVHPDFRSYPRAANGHGLYFVAPLGMFLADGDSARRVVVGGQPDSLTCMGGSVLARGAAGAWLVSGTTVTALDSPDYELISHVDGTDVLRAKDGAVLLYREGSRVAGLNDLPEDFGIVERSWSCGPGAYWIEQIDPESPTYRLWIVR
jgi:hypothetical protein